ncbi:hypothetical protein R3P38DRAFT_2599412 [Favolaschia claudopus]|uniref:Uncharacterized protein n=1 Tax=Favolaschia claudopus TaxID=2862362 RepID=A0AAW0E2U8_9AGAR
MGSSPSIFEKSPQEHAQAAAEELERLREGGIWPPIPAERPGCVRVQFYTYLYRLHDNLRPDMEALVPLEKSGELSLFAVRRLWGLETCSLIDPRPGGLKLGFPMDVNFVPAPTVREMLETYGCMKVIEPYASFETLVKRQTRQIALACASVLHSYGILASAGARADFFAASAFVKRISSKKYRIGQSHYLVINWVTLLILLALTFLYFSPLGHRLYVQGAALIQMIISLRSLEIMIPAAAGTAFLRVAEARTRMLGQENEKMVIVLSG